MTHTKDSEVPSHQEMKLYPSTHPNSANPKILLSTPYYNQLIHHMTASCQALCSQVNGKLLLEAIWDVLC